MTQAAGIFLDIFQVSSGGRCRLQGDSRKTIHLSGVEAILSSRAYAA
jgi:hypothetical protein